MRCTDFYVMRPGYPAPSNPSPVRKSFPLRNGIDILLLVPEQMLERESVEALLIAVSVVASVDGIRLSPVCSTDGG